MLTGVFLRQKFFAIGLQVYYGNNLTDWTMKISTLSGGNTYWQT